MHGPGGSITEQALEEVPGAFGAQNGENSGTQTSW